MHEALRCISKLHEIEGQLRDKPLNIRLAMRCQEIVSLLTEFRT